MEAQSYGLEQNIAHSSLSLSCILGPYLESYANISISISGHIWLWNSLTLGSGRRVIIEKG